MNSEFLFLITRSQKWNNLSLSIEKNRTEKRIYMWHIQFWVRDRGNHTEECLVLALLQCQYFGKMCVVQWGALFGCLIFFGGLVHLDPNSSCKPNLSFKGGLILLCLYNFSPSQTPLLGLLCSYILRSGMELTTTI